MIKKETVPTITKVTSTPDLIIIIVLKFFDMENTVFHVLGHLCLILKVVYPYRLLLQLHGT